MDRITRAWTACFKLFPSCNRVQSEYRIQSIFNAGKVTLLFLAQQLVTPYIHLPIDTLEPQTLYALRRQAGITILPSRSLQSNSGISLGSKAITAEIACMKSQTNCAVFSRTGQISYELDNLSNWAIFSWTKQSSYEQGSLLSNRAVFSWTGVQDGSQSNWPNP